MIYSMEKLKKKYYKDRNKILLKIIKRDFKIWQKDIKLRMKKGYSWDVRYIYDIKRNADISVSSGEVKIILEMYKTLVEQKGYKTKLRDTGLGEGYIKLIWKE